MYQTIIYDKSQNKFFGSDFGDEIRGCYSHIDELSDQEVLELIKGGDYIMTNDTLTQYSSFSGWDSFDLINNKKVVDGQSIIIITPTGKRILTQLKVNYSTEVNGNLDVSSYTHGTVQIELDGVALDINLYQLHKGGCKIVLPDE